MSLQTDINPSRADYKAMVKRIRAAVQRTVEPGASVLVVGKGDRELALLDGCRVAQFPQDETGEYAGYYPEDSAAAIQHLEALRTGGAEYLLFPRTAFWWLDHYAGLRQHLERTYRFLPNTSDDCRIWALRSTGGSPASAPAAPAETTPAGRNLAASIERLLDALLDSDVGVIHCRIPEEGELQLSSRTVWSLPSPEEPGPAYAEGLMAYWGQGVGALLVTCTPEHAVAARSLRAVLGARFRRIAHREHVGSIYELSFNSQGHDVALSRNDG